MHILEWIPSRINILYDTRYCFENNYYPCRHIKSTGTQIKIVYENIIIKKLILTIALNTDLYSVRYIILNFWVFYPLFLILLQQFVVVNTIEEGLGFYYTFMIQTQTEAP